MVTALVFSWLTNCSPAAVSMTSASSGKRFRSSSRASAASVRSPRLTLAALSLSPPAGASRQFTSTQTPRAVGSTKAEEPPAPGIACTASKSRVSGILGMRRTFRDPGSAFSVLPKPAQALAIAFRTLEFTPSQPATRSAGPPMPSPRGSSSSTLASEESTDFTRAPKHVRSFPPEACRSSSSSSRAPHRSDWYTSRLGSRPSGASSLVRRSRANVGERCSLNFSLPKPSSLILSHRPSSTVRMAVRPRIPRPRA
mmetsp:Transcript_17081/g.37647  ORF Transcript_17081/g.37647 Transcript_17081/m.37647 type:complete len:255 (+) Transcript_17081:202-966(+)